MSPPADAFDPAAADAARAALLTTRDRAGGLVIRELFENEPDRLDRFGVEAAGWRLDLSKQRVDAAGLQALVEWAEAAGLRARIDAMFGGETINTTEGRAVLHVALRTPRGQRVEVAGEDVVPAVHEVLDRMAAFTDALRGGALRGFTGEAIRDVVNVGIGGSDLGPAMAARALWAAEGQPLRAHFVSNVDGHDFARVCADLDPARTLFVVCSKTFTTRETLMNARTARAWCVDALGDEAAVASHFAAVSTNLDAVAEFGIPAERTFGFWEWVGGRTSMMSAVGLSLMCQIGAAAFGEMLAGAHAMDEHFRSAPFARNAPALLGLVGAWNVDVLGFTSLAVLPYAQRLARLPAYLQQLEMESNGKRVRIDGAPVDGSTVPVLFGEPGTNGQHAFYQMLHQGTEIVACDFIGFARSADGLEHHHEELMANCFAQSEALAFGRSADELRAAGVDAALIAHRTFPGNRPSTTLVAEALTPHALGALIALYEHKVFVQGVLWGVNSYDQWGVELGKELAKRITPELAGEARHPHDPSTTALIDWFLSHRSG